MKKIWNPNRLPTATAVLGAAGLILRRMLYAFGTDAKNLLVPHHPLAVALWVLTLAALVLIIAAVWKLDGSNRYVDNFSPSMPSAVGHILAAAGILLTVLLKDPMMPGLLGKIWKVLGFLSAPCLVLAGYARMQGKRPFFLLHMVVCLFLVLHIVDHYRVWSGNPQLLDYVFALFGTMALMFFGFYTAAFDVGSGRRRMHLGMGLAAVYLCFVSLLDSGYFFLYLGGIIWVLTGLCTLNPKPNQPPKEGEQEK